MKKQLLFFPLLLSALIISNGNAFSSQSREKDPFITAKVMPLAYDALNGEPKFSSQFQFDYLNRGTVLDSYRGDGVTVAVIDSGINPSHVDFFNGVNTNILSTSAYIQETGSYYSNIVTSKVSTHGLLILKDENGHGTNVAGTIGALVNGIGTAGLSPNVNLLILKTNYYFTEIDAAIKYAADNGADIINMSIGAYEDSFTSPYSGKAITGISGASTYFQSSIDYAFNKGVTIVAAAGNDKTTYSSYPGANANVISVGALTRKSSTTIAGYSNLGLNNVDIVAPGSVYVTDIGSSESYVETQGTSFASPLVASAIALYKQKNPLVTPAIIDEKIKSTAFDLGESGPDATFGYGRLDLSSFMNDVPVTGVSLSPSSLNLAIGETAYLTANIIPSNATNQDRIFISNDDNIATVDEDSGLVRGINIGTTTIGVLTDDGSFEDSVTVTVTKPSGEVTLTSLDIQDDNFSLSIGGSKVLSLSLSPSYATLDDVIFSSSDSSVASVNSSGLVSGLKKGTATITASAKNGSLSDSVIVSVGYSESQTLTYTFTNSTWGASPTSWTNKKAGAGYLNSGVQVTTGSTGANAISPRSFENISSLVVGYATNTSKGAGTINVYLLDNPNNTSSRTLIDSFSVTTAGGTTKRNTTPFIPETLKSGYVQIEVSVTTNSIYICDIKIEYEELIADPIAVSGVEFTLSSLNLTIGNTSQLAYQVLPNDATNKNVSFMSSNSTIASVSSTGLVSALKKGSATITITTEDGDFTDTILLTVNEPISYTPDLNLDDSGFKKSYTFKEELDLAHLSASYKASDGTITQLDGNDLTLVSGGTNTLGPVTLIFSYASLSASINITVTNVGATQGSGQLNDVSLTLNGTNADPSLSTGSTSDYASIAFGDFEFSGKGLRNYNGNLFISSSGYIYNKDPLNDIASIEMNYVTGGSAAAVQDFRFASSVISSTSGVSVFKNLSTSTGGTTATVTAPSNSDYFRIDISNKNLQATIKINFKSGETLKFSASEQADAYYDYFMDLSHEECLIYDVKLTTWNILKTEYQAMVAEGKELLSSSAYQDLLERYILIVTKYGYEDFLGLNISGGENKNFVSSFMSPSPILLITLLTISGVLVSMNVIFLKKKRKDN